MSFLSTKYRHQVTWNGYAADVMKSGLQKYIRRGNVEKALYCAGELDLFKEAPNKKEGETVRTNFLHRLMITYMEDVENLSLFDQMDTTMNALFHEREKEDRNKENEEKWISEVVGSMCLSTKARVCSHIRAVFHLARYKPLHAKYPSLQPLWDEIAYNEARASDDRLAFLCTQLKRHLAEKSILAVYYGFQIELSEEKLKEKLFRSSQPVWFIFQQLMSPLAPARTARVQKFMGWYKDHIGGMAEGFMCWLLPMLHELGVIPEGTPPVIQEHPMNWDQNRAFQKIELDDYVLDRHTSKGRGKGMIEFVEEGAKVEPEADFVNALWKQFYEDGKYAEERGMDAVKGESSVPVNLIPQARPVVPRTEEIEPKKPETVPVGRPDISISTMNDNFVFIDNLYRSRLTLLDILAARGYNVEKYRKFSPAEATAAASSLPSLSFIATKADDTKVCDVRYITTMSRPKLETFFNNVTDEQSENTEVIVMMESHVMDIHHQTACKQYIKWKEEPNEHGEKVRRKLRVFFFSIFTLVVNPMNHVLVPKHEIVPEEEHKTLMESMYITSKSKFPEIKFHLDPIARCIGAVPGDIVKITRPSASSGQAIVYRVCAP